MIRINLLPPEYAEAQARKEKQIIFGAIGGVVLILLMGIYFQKFSYSRGLESDIKVAQRDLDEFKNILQQIEANEKEKKLLQTKRDVIKNLNEGRLNYPVFFEDLLPLIPGNVWVKNINVTENEQNFAVTLQSSALSNFALASWLTNLEESKHFKNIRLGPINYTSTEDAPVVLDFNLNLNYKHQGPMPLSDDI